MRTVRQIKGRHVYPTIALKVEYQLSDLGRELAVPVGALAEFTKQNHDRVPAARSRFDQTFEAIRPAFIEPDQRSVG